MTAIDAIDLTNDGGVLKKVIKEGSSNSPSTGDTVYVHYTGTLENGEEFDSSRTRNEPFSFSLGKSQVISGWDICVATMKIGEICDLTLQPKYAYGANGSPPKIPGNSTLKFNMELIKFEGEDVSPDRDGSITKSIIAEGEKYACPSEYAPVKAHIVGSHQGRVFYDKTIEFELGEGSEHQLPEGVDRALRRVNKGEKCRVLLKGPRFTFGSNPPAEFNLPVNAELEYTLFLTEFEKVKSNWEMTEEEKIEKGHEFKDKGTKFFKEGKYVLALNKYTAISNLLEHNLNEETKEEIEAVLLAAWMNCALVHMKLHETAECIKYCDKVLERQPKNVKAMYRKAQAFEHRKDLDEAIALYKEVLTIDPENKAAKQQILICKQLSAELLAKEKKRFAGMFDRIAMDTPSTSAEKI